jgi:hypothetical protein
MQEPRCWERTDRAIRLIDVVCRLFQRPSSAGSDQTGSQNAGRQRILALALGYQDLIDHDELRHGPTVAVLAGKQSARRKDCAPLAGKSTARLARAGQGAADAYCSLPLHGGGGLAAGESRRRIECQPRLAILGSITALSAVPIKKSASFQIGVGAAQNCPAPVH